MIVVYQTRSIVSVLKLESMYMEHKYYTIQGYDGIPHW